jgi:DNA-binding response OmpR family regulator
MKILVIEDEPQMLENIVRSLKQEQYIVETATDYNSGIEKTGVYEYDCILLDISLPGGSGLKILEQLKKEKKAEGVIILSAKNSLDDKVAGLNLGADDYLPKPFHMVELNARIKSLIRRKKFNGNPVIEVNNVKIDPDKRIVLIDEITLNLNRKEFDVLLYMIVNKNRLVNKSALVEHVWGDYIDETNSFDFIYSQIKNLKKKLKDAGAGIELQAMYGMGYKLVAK